MRYRASAPPKGRWARFLQTQRHQRGWSQTRAFEELREGLHLGPKSRASYVNLDLGNREPTPDEAAFLTSFYEAEPEPATELSTASDISDLTRAIRDQTEVLLDAITARDDVIERLLRELAEYRSAAIQAQVVERSLIEALPQALATALAAMREDDPEDARRVAVPR